MQWARFRSARGEGFGTLEDGEIAEYEGDLFGSPRPTGVRWSSGAYTLLCPCAPTKIVALWNNFTALGEKLGKAPPAHPLFFIKPSTSVIGPHEPIQRPRGYGGKIAFEGELGIVIGSRCKEVPASEAGAHIFGYTCVNDVTAAEILGENSDFAQWCRSKSYDTFGCLGPVIATHLDWRNARVITRLDGVERQNYPLSDMIISPVDIVSQVSFDMTLLPGDVIACGTSLGVGSMKDGSTVSVHIEAIGTLTNVVSPGSR